MGSDFQPRSAGLCLPRRVPGGAAHALAPSLVQILDLKPHCSSLLAETLLPLINGKETGRAGPGALGGMRGHDCRLAGRLGRFKVCNAPAEAVAQSPNLLLTPSAPASVPRALAPASGGERRESRKAPCTAVPRSSAPPEQLGSLCPPREPLWRGAGAGLAPPALCKDPSVPCRSSGRRDPSAKRAGHSLNKGGHSDLSGKCLGATGAAGGGCF